MNQQHLSLCVWQLFNHCKYNITHFWLYLWRKLQWFQQFFCHKNQPECRQPSQILHSRVCTKYRRIASKIFLYVMCSHSRMPEMNNKWKNERVKYVLQYSRTVLCATIRIAFNSSIESKWNPTAPYKWNCKVAVEQLSLVQQLSQRHRDILYRRWTGSDLYEVNC